MRAARRGTVTGSPVCDCRRPPIKGAAGAGDAFAAGVLYGLHEGWRIAECLQLGAAAGAASLCDPTCSEGVLSIEGSLELGHRFGFHPVPA